MGSADRRTSKRLTQMYRTVQRFRALELQKCCAVSKTTYSPVLVYWVLKYSTALSAWGSQISGTAQHLGALEEKAVQCP